jgi:hypothetical protein
MNEALNDLLAALEPRFIERAGGSVVGMCCGVGLGHEAKIGRRELSIKHSSSPPRYS